MSPHARHLLSIHAAVLLFGFAGLFGDKRLLPRTPILIVFGRVVFAALALLLLAAIKRGILRPLSRRGFLAFAVLGVLLAVHWTTFFLSVRNSSVALALITFSTFPLFVAFLEPLFFREKWRILDVVLAIVTLAGLAVLTPGLNASDPTAQGVLWGVASGLTFALLSLGNRRFVQNHSSMTIALYQDLFAALVLLPFAAADIPGLNMHDMLLLAVLGVFCTAVAHSLFIAGLASVSTRTASRIACLEPLYGTILAIFFFSNIPTLRTLLGGIIIVGVAFYTTVRAARPPGS